MGMGMKKGEEIKKGNERERKEREKREL